MCRSRFFFQNSFIQILCIGSIQHNYSWFVLPNNLIKVTMIVKSHTLCCEIWLWHLYYKDSWCQVTHAKAISSDLLITVIQDLLQKTHMIYHVHHHRSVVQIWTSVWKSDISLKCNVGLKTLWPTRNCWEVTKFQITVWKLRNLSIFVFQLKFHWSLFLRVQLSTSQHWFKLWHGT